jgi:hypothetical protein
MKNKLFAAIALAFLAALTPASAASYTNNTFRLATTLTPSSGNLTAEVIAADVNADGKVDLVAGNTVWTNSGRGVFNNVLQYASPYPIYLRTNGFVVADVMGNGRMDLITLTNNATTPVTESILVYTNTGLAYNGNYFFSFGHHSTTTNIGNDITNVSGQIITHGSLGSAGDVFGNGRVNLFYYNSTSNSLSLFTNNGSGVFGSNTTFSLSMGLPAVADVNRDGHVDFIAPNFSNNVVYVFTNNGAGTYGSNATLKVKSPVSVFPADVNGDGWVDLICLSTTNVSGPNYYTNTISIWTNNGSGTFGSNTAFVVGSSSQKVMDVKATTNLFGNGQFALVFAVDDYSGAEAGYLMVYTNNGFGGFGSNLTVTVGSQILPTTLAVADVNGDGSQDLITANYLYNNPNSGSITVFTNTGSGIQSGSFLSNSMPVLTTNLNFLMSADIYRNGQQELLTSYNYGIGNYLLILTNNGSGGFGSNAVVSGFTPPPGYNYYIQSPPIMADIFGNGSPALILGIGNLNTQSGLIMVLTNNGSGIFSTNYSFNTGLIPNKVVAADVNGDGKLDLIMTTWSYTGNAWNLLVLTNNGSGKFGTNVTLTLNGLSQLAVADVNADGRPDLVVAYNYSGYSRMTVFTNISANGTGQLYSSSTTPPNYYNDSTTYQITAGAIPSALVAADVNGDGNMDFIIANNNTPGTLSVMTNSGISTQYPYNSYSFGLNSSPVVSANPQALVAADINGDGKVDLISANLGVATNNNSFGPVSYGTLTVLANNGSGIFTNPATFSTGVGPTALVAMDVNSDGRPDLIALNNINYTNRSVNVTNSAASLSILFNTSNFVNTVVLQTAPSTTAITYGQTLAATGLSGGVATNEAGVAVNGTFAYNNTNSIPGVVSTNPVTFTPTPPTDYQPFTFNLSVTVNPLTAILTGTRAYDGTSVVANNILSVSNKLAGDNVTVSAGSAALAGATIGTNSITSLGNLVLGGTKAANYTLSGAGGAVIITPAVPVVTLASSQNPQFNGAGVSFTATLPVYATGTIQFLTNGVNFDLETITSGSAGSVATSLLPVGSNTITAAYSGDANDQASATSLSQLTDPFPLPVILNGTRVYDGTTNAVYGILSVANKVGSDNVTVSAGSVGLASAMAGMNSITSTNNLALGGLNAANYTLSGMSGAVGITPLPVVLTGTRAYDGTPDAVYGILLVTNNVGGDIVTVSAGSAGLAAANVGTNAITSNNGLALGGLNAANYTPTGVSGSVVITQAVNVIALTSSQNPSGYGVGVNFTATLPSFATGTIQFLTNGVNFDNESLTAGTAGSVTTASLRLGSNNIVAAYSGDANDVAVTNSFGQMVVPPQFNGIVLGSGGLMMSGSFGVPFGTYYILASTDMTLPVNQWTPVFTNQFDGGGNYNFTNPITPAPGVYFILEVP